MTEPADGASPKSIEVRWADTALAPDLPDRIPPCR